MGKSAYDLAVELGFKGTVKEFLYSLRGKDGKSAYELACEHGFRGSVKQWLRSLYGNAESVIHVTGTTDHEALENLAGGDSSGHYHLTKEQYEWLMAQMDSKKYPPAIADNQSVDTVGSQIMKPYEIQGENIK